MHRIQKEIFLKILMMLIIYHNLKGSEKRKFQQNKIIISKNENRK